MKKTSKENVVSIKSWLRQNDDGRLRDLAAKMAELFASEVPMHAEQWLGPNRTTGFSNKPGPIERELILAHLKGRRHVGLLGPASDDTLTQNCLLLGNHKKKPVPGPSEEEDLDDMSLTRALFVRSQLADLGVDTLCVRHDERTYALWIFYDEPLRASATRGFIFDILWSRIPPVWDHSVGVYPLTSCAGRAFSVPPAPLPFGRDRATKLRSYAVDVRGERIEDEKAELERVAPTPSGLIANLAKALRESADEAIDACLRRHGKRHASPFEVKKR